MGMETATMATASMAMQGFGAGMGAMGSYQQAGAQKQALQYQAAVAANNAQIAEWQAQSEQQIGAAQEQNARLQTGQLKASQRTAMAANGISLGEGTATDVLTTTELMGERDALTIRDNAARRAWAARVQASNFASDSAATSATADAINPGMAGLSSLLGGATSVAKSWYGFNRQGVFGAGTGSGSSGGWGSGWGTQ